MRRLLLAASLGVLLVAPGVSSAQLDVGAQGSWGDKFDFAVGGRVTLGLPTTFPVELAGTFDYFFPDADSLTSWELGGALAVGIPIPRSALAPYVGAGVSVASIAEDQDVEGEVIDVDDSTVGFNVLGGVKYRLGSWVPYAEARYALGRDFEKVSLEDGDQFVVTVGIMVNVGPGLTPVP